MIKMKAKVVCLAIVALLVIGNFGIALVNEQNTDGIIAAHVETKASGTTYYVDVANGNDSNNGTSQATAWKSIAKVNEESFSPGDNILFKRGEIWREQLIIPSFGNSTNQITFGDYGTGEKPIISGRDSILGWSAAGNWVQDGNVWSINLANDPYRLFLSGTEYIEAETEGSVDSSERWWYDGDNDNLKVYATMNPSTAYSNVEGARGVAFSTVFVTKSYVILQNLDVRGGTAAIELEDLDHVIIDNCTVGLYSGFQGVRLIGYSSTVDYCEIKNCIIESSYNNWDYSYMRSDGYHLQDGIYIGHGANYNKVYGNTISNWGHACVGVENLDHPAETSNYNEIYENILTSPNTNYNRGFFTDSGSKTGMCAYNKIYRNLIQNTTVRNQIHGNNNEVYYNIIINVIDNPNYGQSYFAQGISMFAAEGQVCHDNKIYNNVICNTDDIGLTIIDDEGWGVKENNLIKNNIIFNFGGDYGISITDWGYGTVKGNTYQNNLIFKFGVSNVIYYRGSDESVSTFNGMNGNNNDAIGNNIQLDPLFADQVNNNFNLQSTSPAIDAGVDVGLTQDFEGNSVPQGIAPDIGAYEFSSAVSIGIIKPRDGYLYVFDRETIPTIFGNIIIIEGITIEADAYDEDGIDRVEFYIDGVLKNTDTDSPYEWLWDEKVIGRHEIKVVAYDDDGNKAEDKTNVIIFNVVGK